MEVRLLRLERFRKKERKPASQWKLIFTADRLGIKISERIPERKYSLLAADHSVIDFLAQLFALPITQNASWSDWYVV
jgi:hypothetical protein